MSGKRMKQVADVLGEKNNFLVVTHVHPDADALGSLTAMGLLLGAMGKTYVLYCESQIPAFAHFLPLIPQVKTVLPESDLYEGVIFLDCADMHRMGKRVKDLNKSCSLINIDHHITNRNFGSVNWVDPDASSTCEMVHQLIPETGISLTADLATALYSGIYSDTGSFSFSNTTARVLSVCSELADHGADPFQIARHIHQPYSRERFQLFQYYLAQTEFSENGKVALVHLTGGMYSDTDTTPIDSSDFINYIKNIRNVLVAAQIQDVIGPDGSICKHMYRVSLRSDGDVDVADIAFGFGGGGHRCASGFSALKKITSLKKYFWKLAEKI